MEYSLNLSSAIKIRDEFNKGNLFGLPISMPEKTATQNIKTQLQRVLFISYAASIDYNRDAESHWKKCQAAFECTSDKWIFSPEAIVNNKIDQLEAILNKYKILRYPQKDLDWWYSNSKVWVTNWGSDPRELFKHYEGNVLQIYKEVKKANLKGLSGEKIYPMWIRILNQVESDHGSMLNFNNFEKLPIPVDIHIARATFTLGLLTGNGQGTLSEFKKEIQTSWEKACAEHRKQFSSDLYPIYFDESAWLLSRRGCHHRSFLEYNDCVIRKICPIGQSCPNQKIKVHTGQIEVDIKNLD